MFNLDYFLFLFLLAKMFSLELILILIWFYFDQVKIFIAYYNTLI